MGKGKGMLEFHKSRSSKPWDTRHEDQDNLKGWLAREHSFWKGSPQPVMRQTTWAGASEAPRLMPMVGKPIKARRSNIMSQGPEHCTTVEVRMNGPTKGEPSANKVMQATRKKTAAPAATPTDTRAAEAAINRKPAAVMVIRITMWYPSHCRTPL